MKKYPKPELICNIVVHELPVEHKYYTWMPVEPLERIIFSNCWDVQQYFYLGCQS